MTTTPGVRTLHHWVAGAEHAGSGDRFSDVTDPATGEVTARLSLASGADVEAAVAAAKAAFPGWRDTSLARRTQIVFRFRELLNDRAGELAELITAEHGKVLSDARGEVARGQEVVEFACGIPHLLKGGFTENASTKVDVASIRQPLGPVAVNVLFLQQGEDWRNLDTAWHPKRVKRKFQIVDTRESRSAD